MQVTVNDLALNGKDLIDMGFKGTEIGKIKGELLDKYLSEEIPNEKEAMLAYVKEKYLKWSGLTYPQIIDKVYRQPLANRFLAGISLFIKENLKYYELRDLVIYNFQCFFEKNVLRYSSDSIRTLSAVGGVASAFEEELRGCAELFNYKIGKVIDAPIDGLIGYYSETI